MKRTLETKFFTFNQNNSGGYFIINDYVAKHLIIEAINVREAINRMRDITQDYSTYCACCGERWSSWKYEEDGEEVPTVWGIVATEPEAEEEGSTIIYYYDGSKQKLWYE